MVPGTLKLLGTKASELRKRCFVWNLSNQVHYFSKCAPNLGAKRPIEVCIRLHCGKVVVIMPNVHSNALLPSPATNGTT